ncbi:MAG: SRPBCC domain-containing protein [Bacteroidales bacterium]|nr:SRPBCC domain-containing protein [Bacteroidales bacterium]
MSEKVRFQLEYSMNTSAKILYNRLSTPAGLAEWFSDDVNVVDNNSVYVFIWEGSEQRARVTSKKDLKHIRFHWIDEEDDENAYFEFKINIDDLTSDLALMISDAAEPDEIEDSKSLWDTQITNLRSVLGS